MRIVPNISVVYPGQFPGDYVNDVQGWSFDQSELQANPGKLLTLDIDFGEACSLNCSWCFRKNGAVDKSGRPVMDYKETVAMLEQAKQMGLRKVKFLGAGEPFENAWFLHLLRLISALGIESAVFTKGHVLGSDELAERNFGADGIRTAEQLVQVIGGMSKVSILLSFQSFDTALQDSLVGRDGYTQMRNNAIKLLCKHGFTKTNPTRLALAVLPVTKTTIGEAFEIYCWARERNMYPCVCPSMCSGRSSDADFRKAITPSDEELFQLYTRIYRYNLGKGIQTIGKIREQGVASYAGGAPCKQIACGMYITSRGLVLRCPGDDVTVFGDIRQQSLEEIWHGSENFKRGPCGNCKCPPKDGKTIPTGLYDEVLVRLS